MRIYNFHRWCKRLERHCDISREDITNISFFLQRLTNTKWCRSTKERRNWYCSKSENRVQVNTREIEENVVSTIDNYPKFEDLILNAAPNFIPEPLRIMLNKIFLGNQIQQKVDCIGSAILQAARPRDVIVPLWIILVVQMYHHLSI